VKAYAVEVLKADGTPYKTRQFAYGTTFDRSYCDAKAGMAELAERNAQNWIRSAGAWVHLTADRLQIVEVTIGGPVE